jgi:hypothetical protein
MTTINKQSVFKILILFFFILSFSFIFIEIRAQNELNLARAAVSVHDSAEAIRHYFQSLNWYAPWGSSQTAAKELLSYGLTLENNKETKMAVQAFYRLRAGLVGARSFYLPHPKLIAKANEHIASYLASQKLGEKYNFQDFKNLSSFYLELYSSSPTFNEGWYFVAIGGFLLWVSSGFKSVFILLKKDTVNLFTKRLSAFRYSALLFIIGYIMWIIGLKMA